MSKFKLQLVLSLTVLGLLGLFVSPTSVNALSGSEFRAGRIIDDSIFFNTSTIGSSDIQLFLNSKVPSCDTSGTQPYADTTRAAYGTSRGYPPPYTCLRYYSQDTPSKGAESGLCNQYNGGLKSAASIIYDVGQACGINPRVLIVLLQKEQRLVTDDWPWPIQYTKATGYGCPDTPLGINVDANQNGCYDEFEGFFNQVYTAARQFKRYARDESFFRYRPHRDNYIQYNPNVGCGGTNVYIQNQATAGLYNYTPYQPNASALANLYGSGDDCGAYGNRNFWRLFNDWFGGVNGPPYYWQFVGQTAYSNSSRTQPFTSVTTTVPGGRIYLRVQARNQGFQTWDPSFVNLATSNPQDRTSAFYDSSWITTTRVARLIEPSVAPGQVGTFEFAMTAPQNPGSYSEYFNLVAEGHTWLNDIGLYYYINVVIPTPPVNDVDSTLNSGEEITLNSYTMSPDTQSVLRLQPDGNLVLYSNFSNPVWNSGTSTTTTGRLVMQPDGNLVLYRNDGNPVWYTNTYGNPGARLEIQTDGNMVIYTPGNASIWATNTTHNPNHLSYVNTELYPATLLPLQSIETANRKYRLVLQPDSNLVLYSNNSPIWATGTSGRNVSRLALQPDGNLVLYDKSGFVVWHTNTYRSGASKLVIQPDGNLVLYNSVQATWNSGTAGR